MRTQICPRCGNILLDGKHHINTCSKCGWHAQKSFEEFCRQFNHHSRKQAGYNMKGR